MIPRYDYTKFTDETLKDWERYIGGRTVDGYNSDIAKIVQRDWMLIQNEIRSRKNMKEKTNVAS